MSDTGLEQNMRAYENHNSIIVLDDVPEKQQKDGPSVWDLAHTWEPQMEFLVPGFSVAKP